MTLTFDSAGNAVRLPDRRSDARVRVGQMIYVKVGDGNGGFILNISEGGLAIQAAMPLIEDEFPSIRFHFSRSEDWIEASGIIVWKNESKKVAGVKFVDLPEESRVQISDWISQGAGAPILGGAATARPMEVPAKALTGGIEKSVIQEASGSAFEPETRKPNSIPPLDPITAMNGGKQGGSTDERSEPRQPEVLRPRQVGISKTLLKKYLVDERHRIRLYDLVSEKAEKLCNELTERNFPSDVPVTEQEFIRRLHRYEEMTEELVSIFTTGCFWGETNQELIWVKLLERVANAPATHKGRPQWLALQSYPALLLLYAGGVAAIANEKYSTLEALLVKPRLIGPDGDCRLVDRLSAAAVVEDERFVKAIGGGTRPAALSAHLCKFLREQFREFVPSDDVYDEIFDHFEYLFSLVWIDENPIGASLGWVPLGRFAWRQLSGLQSGASVMGRISAEVSQQGKDWPLFRAGLFGGSMQRFVSARNRVATFIASQR